MRGGQATVDNDCAALQKLLATKGYRRPRVVATGGTWPQQYRVSIPLNGAMRGISGSYAELVLRIAAPRAAADLGAAATLNP